MPFCNRAKLCLGVGKHVLVACDLRLEQVRLHLLPGLLELRDGSGGVVLHNELARFNITRTLVVDLLDQKMVLLAHAQVASVT